MSTEKCDLQRLDDWQKMLRDSVVIRSILTRESSSTCFRIELIFMGERHHILEPVSMH